MPLILGAQSAVATGFSVDNSCRFNAGDSAVLSQSQSTSPTNDDICTMSLWFKPGNIDVDGSGFGFSGGDDASNRFSVTLLGSAANNSLYLYGKVGGSLNLNLASARLFRDVSAWYHLVVAVDTTQGVEASRVRCYINNEEVTLTGTFPSQNDNCMLVKGGTFDLGCIRGGSWQQYNFTDGYMAEAILIDGQQLTPSSFGEADEDSPTIWKPINVSGLTFGTNGFYMDFKDSSALGNDVSGNNNDFTATNLAAVDSSTDTPTNNFCTGNPIIHGGKLPTISEGNCLFVSGGDWMHIPSTIGVANGKWYAEFKCVAKTGGQMMGVIDSGDISGWGASPAAYVGNAPLGHCYQDNGNKQTGDTATSYGDTYTAGDIIGAALNADDGEITFYKNNAVQASGTAITLPTSTSSTGIWFWLPSVETGTIAANWGGCSAFAISSAANDENGYGIFEYAPPSDYLAICTKNLATNG